VAWLVMVAIRFGMALDPITGPLGVLFGPLALLGGLQGRPAGRTVADADRGCWRPAVPDGPGAGSGNEGDKAPVEAGFVPSRCRIDERLGPSPSLVLGHRNESRQRAACDEGRAVHRHITRKPLRPLLGMYRFSNIC
jgi:hypothetical protein